MPLKSRRKSAYYASTRSKRPATAPAKSAADGEAETRFGRHVPVMLAEVVQALLVHAGDAYIDCTVGEGGHLEAIWQHSQPGGRVLGIDADEAAIARARVRFAPYQQEIVVEHGNFRDVEAIAHEHGFAAVQGIVLDLGLNTRQLGSGRGFSFHEDAPLDMRFDRAQPLTADQVVNHYPEDRLAQVLREYGEEPRARRIARAVVRQRPVRTALELGQIVGAAVGSAGGRIHPATRTFQAVRIEVNQELASLETGLKQAIRLLAPGGRVAVVSFHSLEDRVVKQVFQRARRGCGSPADCADEQCLHKPVARRVEPKLWRPSPEETDTNPRSRSARMRVLERLPEG
ncbi:MAG: 16S rRNA (cytosine(1402)-N(4))-methyltransferase RsmH [Dehalococcoidia bacterium]|nr:16S rRNA (cytosine(1402)-N(4))-methyltransferase RsmH [Dehalococcoidia bacterium]